MSTGYLPHSSAYPQGSSVTIVCILSTQIEKTYASIHFCKMEKKMHSIAKRGKNAKLCFAESEKMILIELMNESNYSVFAIRLHGSVLIYAFAETYSRVHGYDDSYIVSKALVYRVVSILLSRLMGIIVDLC